MHKKKIFISSIAPPPELLGPAWWFAFQGDRLLVQPKASSLDIPCLVEFGELGLTAVRRHYLGQLAGRHCYAVDMDEGIGPPAGMEFQGLRQVYGLVDEDIFAVAGRALQIVEWDRTNQYCSRCGRRMEPTPTERAKECPRCGLLAFPRLSPAIIVLVERGDQLLLARPYHFPPGRYSVIAGFVEPGETLEEAVVREVREEVGLTLKDIRYFGSQPWPFPHSLMVGFTASYAGGEISLDDGEIEDAGWFTPDHLPDIPGKISIARRLIDYFLAKHGILENSDPKGPR
jgi:NAD+ diphosphatase